VGRSWRLTGDWAEKPSASTGAIPRRALRYFKEQPCSKGDYKDAVREQPGSAAVVAGPSQRTSMRSATPDRIQDGRRARGPLAAEDGEGCLRGPPWRMAYSAEYPLRAISPPLREHGPGKTLDPSARVPQVRPEQGRAGGRVKLHSPHGGIRDRGVEEARAERQGAEAVMAGKLPRHSASLSVIQDAHSSRSRCALRASAGAAVLRISGSWVPVLSRQQDGQ